MNKLKVVRNVCGIEGLTIIEPSVFYDERGYLMECFHQKDLAEKELQTNFVQENEAYNKKGVLRGMHVNINHPQEKLIRVVSGKILDVIVDLRKESPTYKKSVGIELSAENKKQLYIPESMGHGYLALEESYVLFHVTMHYIPNDEVGFAWNSNELNIIWPMDAGDIILSEKDAKNPDLSKLNL